MLLLLCLSQVLSLPTPDEAAAGRGGTMLVSESHMRPSSSRCTLMQGSAVRQQATACGLGTSRCLYAHTCHCCATGMQVSDWPAAMLITYCLAGNTGAIQ
jgi:hypothetical protein